MLIAEILAVYFLLSLITAACWSAYRHFQKRAEARLRLAIEAYQLERARHHHIVTEYRRIGAL